MPITQRDREREAEHNRRLMVAEADADRKYRNRLQAIKDKMDLFGEDSLDVQEVKLVKKHEDWFYPNEEG